MHLGVQTHIFGALFFPWLFVPGPTTHGFSSWSFLEDYICTKSSSATLFYFLKIALVILGYFSLQIFGSASQVPCKSLLEILWKLH